MTAGKVSRRPEEAAWGAQRHIPIPGLFLVSGVTGWTRTILTRLERVILSVKPPAQRRHSAHQPAMLPRTGDARRTHTCYGHTSVMGTHQAQGTCLCRPGRHRPPPPGWPRTLTPAHPPSHRPTPTGSGKPSGFKPMTACGAPPTWQAEPTDAPCFPGPNCHHEPGRSASSAPFDTWGN